MTLVSFVRGAYETRKPRASTRGWNSFSDKNSFRYTNKWLPTAYFIERSFSMSKDDKSLSHTRWNCKYHIVFTPKYRRKVIYGELRKDIDILISGYQPLILSKGVFLCLKTTKVYHILDGIVSIT